MEKAVPVWSTSQKHYLNLGWIQDWKMQCHKQKNGMFSAALLMSKESKL